MSDLFPTDFLPQNTRIVRTGRRTSKRDETYVTTRTETKDGSSCI